MNKKVYSSMLVLCIFCILASYFLKWFYPEPFIMVITNPRLIAIGEYIDNHNWAYLLCGSAFSFITYYLYTAACIKAKWLTRNQMIAILAVVLGSYVAYAISPKLGMHYSVCSMFLIPAVYKADLRDVAIIYSIHGLSQILTLDTRELPLNTSSFNSLQVMVLTFDCYIWLVLFWLMQRNNREEMSLWDSFVLRITELKKIFLKKKLPTQKP